MLKLLQSIDAFLYEVAFWPISIPRTYFKVLFRPRWISNYVRSELENDPANRYESYASPMLFFVVVGVLPLLALANHLAGVLQEVENNNYANYARKFLSASFEGRFTAIAVFLTSFPMGFSVVIQRIRRGPLTRTAMQHVFYTQCMCFAVFYPLIVGTYSLLIRYMYVNKGTIGEDSFPWILLPADFVFLHFLFYEVRIITKELNIGWWKALLVMLLSYLVSIGIMLLLEAVLLLLIL